MMHTGIREYIDRVAIVRVAIWDQEVGVEASDFELDAVCEKQVGDKLLASRELTFCA